MNVISRNFGKLFFLALAGGLAAGAVMAQKGMQVDLGTIGGVKIALAAPAVTKAPLVPAGLFSSTPQATSGQPANPAATPVAGQATSPGATTAGGAAFGRGTTGTVQKVDGKTITITDQDGSAAKATVSDSTIYVKSSTITAADLKAGDTVTVVGQAAADGSITAQQVTTGAVSQMAGAGGFGRQGGMGGAGGTGRTGAMGGQAAGLAMVVGTVQKVDGSALTVAVEGGQPTKVTIGADTRLTKTAPATLADVTSGSQVTITGQAAADGSIAAVSVQIGSLR